MKLKCVTFTGVDIYTNLEDLVKLNTTYPWVEFGILLSLTNKGNRYPEDVKLILKELVGKARISLHVCGKAVPLAMNFNPDIYEILKLLYRSENRLQLNFNHSKNLISIPQLSWFMKQMHLPVIIQVNDNNKCIPNFLRERKNAQYLFDSSGGSGKVLEYPEAPPISIMSDESAISGYGYSGGINKDNLFEILGKIGGVLPDDYKTWIDMESSVRNESDKFDIDKCCEIIDLLIPTNYVTSHMDY